MQLLFNEQKLTQFSLYCPQTDLDVDETETKTTFKDKENELKKVSDLAQWGISGKAFLPEFENNQSLSECCFMNNTIVENIKLPLQEGVWFDKYQNKNEAAAIISTDLADRLKLENEYTVMVTDGYETEKITLRIIGVLNKDNKMLSLSGIKANDLFTTGFSGMAVFLPDMNNINLNIIFSNFLVKNCSEIENSQYLIPISRIIEKYTEDNKLLIGVVTIFAIMSVALSFSGIGASVALKSKSEIKKYAIYYFCGAQWKMCILIELAKTIFTFLIAIIPILILYFIFYHSVSEYCTFETLMIGISVSLIIYLPSSIWKMIQIIKESPIHVIKNS